VIPVEPGETQRDACGGVFSCQSAIQPQRNLPCRALRIRKRVSAFAQITMRNNKELFSRVPMDRLGR